MPFTFDATSEGLERLAPGFDLGPLDDISEDDLISLLALVVGLLGGLLPIVDASATDIVYENENVRIEITGSNFSPVTTPQAFDDAFGDQTASGVLDTVSLIQEGTEVANLEATPTGWTLTAGSLVVLLDGNLPTALADIYVLEELLFAALDGNLTATELAAIAAPLAGFTLDGLSIEADGTQIAELDGASLEFFGYVLNFAGTLPDPINDLAQVLTFGISLLLGDNSLFSLDGLSLVAPDGTVSDVESTDDLAADLLNVLLGGDLVGAFFGDATYTVDGANFQNGLLDVPEDGTDNDGLLETSNLEDVIFGFGGNDTINAGGRSDLADGGEGNDEINGGFGFDTLRGGDGDDLLIGLQGFDLLEGQAGNDTLLGNFGNDTLMGGDNRDDLNGGLGFDYLDGGNGVDYLAGLDGFDTLLGGAGNDTLLGNNGNDTLRGGDGNDLLEGGLGADSLYGDGDDDRLFGNNGFDYLLGGAGMDRLEGNAGNDTLNGEAGDDVLKGGLGADLFIFFEGSGMDRIADLQAVDQVALDPTLLNGASLDTFAETNADGVLVLNFGDGDTLTFTGYTELSEVENNIVFLG